MTVPWPDGKLFAFTVFDDTDLASKDAVAPVYDLLEDLGFRTTKSVWPVRGMEAPVVGGATCEDPDYLDWVRGLQPRGFEIGYHLATFTTSGRQQTLRALDRFRDLFGHSPYTMANHVGCLEGIYWGDRRLEGVNRAVYNVLTRFAQRNRYRGHVADDPLFWGDLCLERIRYVRNFTYRGINTLKQCSAMPYHDERKPYVRAWFAASEGGDAKAFVRCLDESAQDQLEVEGGACIMYTHFAAGFVEDGILNPRFVELMRRLSRKQGWYVPVSELLAYLEGTRGVPHITNRQRREIERRWIRDKMLVGHT